MPKTKKASAKPSSSQLIKYLGIGALIVLAFVFGTLYQQKNYSKESSPAPQTNQSEQEVMNNDETEAFPASEQGARLEEIKFTLPTDWKSEIKDGSLWLTPVSGGGYYAIKVYEYSGTVGRREFYCSLVDSCIDSSTFEPTQIGNISGYAANGLDNSGSGQVYFGAKGNSFYVIDSYNPPAPNNFENQRQGVLDSLVF